MEEEKESKSKKTKLLTILIFILAGAGVILITFSLLFGFGILGNKKIASSSGESEAEEAAGDNNESPDIVSMTVDEAYEVYNRAGEGISEWEEKGYPYEQTEEGTSTTEDTIVATLISVEEVYEIITNNEDYFILDVRNQDEYDEAHIEGVVLIPVDTLESRLSELPEDKPIIVYCKAGGRS